MISEDLIDMLIDPDPEVRKQGVTIIGKSKNPDALPYLAEVYRDDEDSDVRELARKAGLYIKKYANAQTAQRPTATTPDNDAGNNSLYTDDDNIGDDVMLADVSNTLVPSDLKISKVNEERAKGLLQQALDLNMRGDNQRAIKALERALATDPRLGYDSYTTSFAATVTGMPGQEAIQSLMPDDATLEKMKRANTRRKRSGLHLMLAYCVIVAGVMVLASYLLMPWFAIGTLELTEPTTGQVFTVNEVWGVVEDALVDVPDSPENNELLDAYSTINFDVNGLNTSLYAVGVNNLGTMVGLNDLSVFIESFGTGLLTGLLTEAEFAVLRSNNDTQPLHYSMLAVPAGAVLALLLSIFLLLRGGSTLLWVLLIIMGLLIVIPSAYYFTAGEESLRTGINWLLFMEIPTPDSPLIGMGFWVSLVGGLLILLIPFLAMLTEPAE